MYNLDNVLLDAFKSRNDKNISALEDKIKNEELFNFVLGAGISISVGLPDWGKLLSCAIGNLLYTYTGEKYKSSSCHEQISQLQQEALNYEKTHIENKFLKGVRGDFKEVLQGSNLLETAEYILNYLEHSLRHQSPQIKRDLSEKKIVSLIRNCLHKSDDELKQLLNEKYKGSTLESIVKAVCKISKNGSQKNEVITYNYDNLLEYCLINKAGIANENIKSISYTDKDKATESDKINICHIHGKINITSYDDASDSIILSESSYHEMEKTQYMWIHTVQANSMLNNTCLFVGFSAEDYNFRRIIRHSEEVDNCYIIFTVDDLIKRVFSETVKDIQKKEKQHLMKEEYDKKVQEIFKAYSKDDERVNHLKRIAIDDKKIKIRSENEILEGILKDSKSYQYEKLFLTYLIDSQHSYWEKQHITPIWTTIHELPKLINHLFDN